MVSNLSMRPARLVIPLAFLITIGTRPQLVGQSNQPAQLVQVGPQLTKAADFFREMSLLQRLGQDSSERPAVLERLHKMWSTYDVLRRPAIAYLMCQLGDRSGVESVAKAFFAGEYDTARELEPDGAAAGANATDEAFRLLTLYGTPQVHLRLLAFLKLSEDPLRKGAGLCGTLLGLSSTDNGPGLPQGYSKEHFPLDLAVACLDYREEVEMVVSAPGGSALSQVGRTEGSITVYGVTGSYTVRGSDEGSTGDPESYREGFRAPHRGLGFTTRPGG